MACKAMTESQWHSSCVSLQKELEQCLRSQAQGKSKQKYYQRWLVST